MIKDIILIGERLVALPVTVWNKTKMSAVSTSIQFCTEVLAREVKKKEERHQGQKGRSKALLHMI